MSTDRPGSSRRDFLTGRAAQSELASTGAATATALAEGLAEENPAVPSGGDALHLATRAMNCEFAVVLNPGPSEQILAASAALDLVHVLEEQMSVYRPHSELSRLNARAARETIRVESRLFALLVEARRISMETEGAFDPTSGPLIALWRRCRDESRVPTQGEIDAARERTGMAHVAFDESGETIRFGREGIELNLGAIGKGHALDRVAEQLQGDDRDWGLDGRASRHGNDRTEPLDSSLAGSRGPRPKSATPQAAFLLHGGHSSLVARGNHNQTGGWPVGLRNPAFPAEQMATILLKDVAMATSGAGEQFYRHEGRRFGHILDPRTGWPTEGMLSVTVLAPTAAEADALSTAFFVGGVEIARRYCDNHPMVSVLFTPPLRQGRTAEIHTLNVPERVVFPLGSTAVSRVDSPGECR